MKKAMIFLVLAISIFAVTGCGNSEIPSASAVSEQEMQSAAAEDLIDEENSVAEKEWNKKEIKSMYEKVKSESWDYIDCVPVSDFAYDRVGVVLFYDSEQENSNAAFFDKDGNYQMCGVFAKACSEPDLTYHGDGVVTFYLEAEEDSAYRCKISFSADGSDVSFVREDGEPEQK